MADDDRMVEAAAERVLIQGSIDGDHQAWQQLMERHVPRLSAYLGARLRRHEVVEKLVGECIYAAWRHLAEFPQSQDFGTWFRRIGAHLAMRWHGKNPEVPLVAEFPKDRCEGLEQHRQMQALERAMGQLSDQHRMAIEQRFRGGVDGHTLADILHVDQAKADALVEAALDALDAALNGAAGSE